MYADYRDGIDFDHVCQVRNLELETPRNGDFADFTATD
jgi:hypothetical protein